MSLRAPARLPRNQTCFVPFSLSRLLLSRSGTNRWRPPNAAQFKSSLSAVSGRIYANTPPRLVEGAQNMFALCPERSTIKEFEAMNSKVMSTLDAEAARLANEERARLTLLPSESGEQQLENSATKWRRKLPRGCVSRPEAAL